MFETTNQFTCRIDQPLQMTSSHFILPSPGTHLVSQAIQVLLPKADILGGFTVDILAGKNTQGNPSEPNEKPCFIFWGGGTPSCFGGFLSIILVLLLSF
jgi:hypothetical protein